MDGRAACIATVAFGLAGPVLADGPAPLAEPVVVAPAAAPAVDWTGPYAGLSFGGAWSDGEVELDDAFGGIIERDVSLGLFPGSADDRSVVPFGSANVGYNMQRDSFVGGIEVDIGAMGEADEVEFSRIDPGGQPPFDVFDGVDTKTSYTTNIDTFGSLRLRGGFAQDRNLFFATAGVAAGQVENRFALDVADFPDVFGGPISEDWSEEGVRYGYILGLGMERRVTDRLSIKGEILYYDLEDVTVEARSGRFPGDGLDYEFDNAGTIARVGINFKF